MSKRGRSRVNEKKMSENGRERTAKKLMLLNMTGSNSIRQEKNKNENERRENESENDKKEQHKAEESRN